MIDWTRVWAWLGWGLFAVLAAVVGYLLIGINSKRRWP